MPSFSIPSTPGPYNDDLKDHFGRRQSNKSILGESLEFLSRLEGDARYLFANAILRVVLLAYTFYASSAAESLALTAFLYRVWYDLFNVAISLAWYRVRRTSSSAQETAPHVLGRDRWMVLLAFSNSALCLFTSSFILFELVEWIFTLHHGPPDTDANFLTNVAILCTVVAFVCHALLRQNVVHADQQQLLTMSKKYMMPPPSSGMGDIGAVLTGGTKGDVLSELVHSNVPALLLFVNAWLLSFGWVPADPLAAIVISISSFGRAVPLVDSAGRALLLATPVELSGALNTCVREAAICDGVLECTNQHFWTHAPGVHVGSITIRVRSDAVEQEVRSRVRKIFAHLVSHLTVEMEKVEWNSIGAPRSGAGAASGQHGHGGHGHSHGGHGHSHGGHGHSHGSGEKCSGSHNSHQEEDVTLVNIPLHAH